MSIRVIRGSACLGINLPCEISQASVSGSGGTAGPPGPAGAAANTGTYGLRLLALAAGTGRGAVNTSVLLFSTAPATGDFGVPTSAWLTQTNDADDGSEFAITMPGTYVASLMLPSTSAAPSDSPVAGISLNASGAVLTTAPIMGFSSVQASTAEQDASLPSTIFCSAPIYVPQEEIDAGRNIIRFHATPTSPLLNNLVAIVLRRVGDAQIPA